MRLPVIAIVGRPNVGKSTLFNRLAKKRISIVEDTPGVTRDRIYAETVFDDMAYVLIDTGGFEADPDTQLFQEIRNQSLLAMEEADVVVFVVDARAGATPADKEVAQMLRKSGRPLFVAANKCDSPKQADFSAEFYEMGVDAIFPISAEHGLGVSDLMDGLVEALPADLREHGERVFEDTLLDDEDRLDDDALDAALDKAEASLMDEAQEDPPEAGTPEQTEDVSGVEGIEHSGDDGFGKPRLMPIPEILRVAVIGKPNAGKSSLCNKLIGEDRNVVSDLPGTTMDAVDSFFSYGGQDYRLVDTAGIRRKRSISRTMEKYAVVAALKGLDRCDIALLMIDATQGLTEQDMKVAAFAHDKGKALIILVNKWDLAKENELNAEEFKEELRYRMPFVSYAPIRFISAKTGRRVFDILDTVRAVADSYFMRVSTSRVNQMLQAATAAHQPPVHQGRRVKLYFATQVSVAPPTFVFATNEPKGIHFSYRRFLMNRVRDEFRFEGAPVRLFFRPRGDQKGREKNIEARKRRKARDRLKGVKQKRPRRS